MTMSIWKPGMSTSPMTVGMQSMQTGYRLAGALLREMMHEDTPHALDRWNTITNDSTIRILSVGAHDDEMTDQFDHMNFILEANDIPHARIGRSELLHGTLDQLPQANTLLINCASHFNGTAARRAAMFVRQGGLLITSDWAVKNVIQEAFPGTLEPNGRETLGTEFISIRLYNEDNPNTRLLKRLFDATEAPPVWWLEPESFPFKIMTQSAEILLYSNELKRRYDNGSVMVRFPWGKGQVVHMISHAFLEEMTPQPLKARSALPADRLTQRPTSKFNPKTTQAFTARLGATDAITQAYTRAEKADPQFNVGTAASTTISTAAFLTSLFSFEPEK